jgi:hypothetical protein
MMMDRNTHLELELLSAYLDNEVSQAERARVEAHIATCDACHRELESLRYIVSLLQRLPVAPAPRTFYVTEAMLEPEPRRAQSGPSWLGRWQALFGTVAAVATLLLCVVLFQMPQTAPPEAGIAMMEPAEEALEAARVPDAPIEEALEEAAAAMAAEPEPDPEADPAITTLQADAPDAAEAPPEARVEEAPPAPADAMVADEVPPAGRGLPLLPLVALGLLLLVGVVVAWRKRSRSTPAR